MDSVLARAGALFYILHLFCVSCLTRRVLLEPQLQEAAATATTSTTPTAPLLSPGHPPTPSPCTARKVPPTARSTATNSSRLTIHAACASDRASAVASTLLAAPTAAVAAGVPP